LKLFSEDVRTEPPAVVLLGNEGEVLKELRTRMLFSALVDADYLDTERHFARAAGRKLPDLRFPGISTLRTQLTEHLRSLARNSKRSSLNKTREQTCRVCAEKGKTSKPGVFSLSVPTGGGKTLASALFALTHAERNSFKRMIYVIPYTSIIEQNARVFAGIFGEEAVLEHHSLARWQEADEEEPDSLAQQKRHAAENWDAPFIVTTNVQFFESLFSHRPAACRKLHRLAEAVIIFDECQTFPPELLHPTLERLKALVSLGKTSLVFCTATQPSLACRAGFAEGFPEMTEIIPPGLQLHQRPEFCRTNLTFRRAPITPDALCQELRAVDRALVVVNTRQQAWEVFQALRAEGVYHLSTLMCPAHRETVLDTFKARLAVPNARCLVISTQLVEAGVDIDFPTVYRALGPLDSIIQAAGRCNREGMLQDENGETKAGEVIVFQFQEHRLPPGTYRRATELAGSADFLPDRLEGNFPPETIRRYFESLYNLTERDKHNIAQLCRDLCYRQIGEKYRWIESDTEPVLTDYSAEGAAWQAAISANEFAPLTRQQWRAIARYCINLPKPQVEETLQATPKLHRLRNGLVLSQERAYDPEFGFNHFGKTPVDLLIC
jgi:CRISPR-associated endonuclease/helicase Cas3